MEVLDRTPEPIDSLVERVLAGLKDPRKKWPIAIAALTELAERVKAAEFTRDANRETINDLTEFLRRDKQALAAAVAQRDELVEALERELRMTHGDDTIKRIRAALDKVRSEDDFLPIGHPTC